MRDSHVYRIGGHEGPSVTQILKAVSDRFPAEVAHLATHGIPYEHLDRSELVVKALIAREDRGCNICTKLLDTFLSRDAEVNR